MRKSELRGPKGTTRTGGQTGADGALSAGWRFWQSLRLLRASGVLAATALSLPVGASEIGPVKVMKQGHYLCETPGNALGKTGIHQPQEDFSILHGSVYGSGDLTGIYLLTGDILRFTSGPRKGDKFRRVSENFLRKLDKDGQDTNLRCIRSVLNNLEANEPLPPGK
jgi:hypothetical protein